jgi:hypothetical protein
MELGKVKRYFLMNPGVLLIIVFQVLILTCASMLIVGNNALANYAAVSAYCFLVVGIIFQAAKSVEEKHLESVSC